MDYLKKFVTKLLCNSTIGNHQNLLITYSEMAHTMLSTMIVCILYAYSMWYPLLDASWYCMIIAIGYILYTAVKIIIRYRLCPLPIHSYTYSKLIVITVIASIVLGALSYYHGTTQINHYIGNYPFYINQEGDYALLIDSPVETISVDGREYKKCSAALLGMHPIKDTAGLSYIRAHDHIRITIEESDVPLRMGALIILRGTPKSLYVTEERGTIDSRSRAIRSEEKGKIFGGTYRIMTTQDYEDYHIYKRTIYYSELLGNFGAIRHYVETMMTTHLSDSTKWLATSLIIGGHYGELGDDMLKSFGFTGIIHILSISGSHIALLFTIVYALCRILHIKKRYAMIGGIVVSMLYCTVVGLSAPVMRSTIMGICMSMAYLLGRLYAAKQGLAITGMLFLMYDPLLILDVSFQLSFGATYGLLIFGMPLYRWITWIPPMVKAPIVLCISAQLMMIPFQLYYFHYLSVASIMAALVVTPILDISIVLLFIATVISTIVPLSMLWSCIELLLELALHVNTYIANNQSLIVWAGIMPPILVILYMLVVNILYMLLVPCRQKYRAMIMATCIGLIAILGSSYSAVLYKNQTILHIVPLKQANVLIAMSPYHKQGVVYIDAPDGIPIKASEYRIVNALHSYGISPKSIAVKPFQSNGGHSVLYENDMVSVMVYNRQSGEKKLQLKDTKHKILITANAHVIESIGHEYTLHDSFIWQKMKPTAYTWLYGMGATSGKRPPVLVTMPRGALRDVDPDNEGIWLWGYRYMPDIIV